VRYYTYKITFSNTPYFYWGYHKHSGKEYWGSPSTNKWVWDLYEPEKQILEWFETREEAVAVEKRLIKPYLNDPNCLNEGCGPGYSQTACSRGGKIGGKRAAEINSEKGSTYWKNLSRVGLEGRLKSVKENPEEWSRIGRIAADTRWQMAGQREINAESCREVGRRNRGSRWATNGVKVVKVMPGEDLPEGYQYGRIYRP
jgi:hypothetical protein